MGSNVTAGVGVVALTVRDDALHALVDQQKIPHRPLVAGDGLQETASRVLHSAAGLDHVYIDQIGAYKHGGSLIVAYVACIPISVVNATPPSAATWEPVSPTLNGTTPCLLPDHAQIVTDAVHQVRDEFTRTTLATEFCPPEFTVTDLRRVYEIVWDKSLDQRNFNRKITTAGILVPTGTHTAHTGSGRPAMLYRRGPATTLHPPMSRDLH